MARVAPIGETKWYGTEVRYLDEEGRLQLFHVQANPPDEKWTASERELAGGWIPERGRDNVEDERSLAIARIIVEALTKAGY